MLKIESVEHINSVRMREIKDNLYFLPWVNGQMMIPLSKVKSLEDRQIWQIEG